MEYRVYEGKKARFESRIYYFDFECDPDDIDAAYDILAESIILKDQDKDSPDLNDFRNLKDDNVEIMLKDAKKQGFISDYEIKGE